MSSDYLKPSTRQTDRIRPKNNGQFVNPPPYMDKFGGFTSGDKVGKTGEHMRLEKKPSSRGSKPL
jgi:hypothetical protein